MKNCISTDRERTQLKIGSIGIDLGDKTSDYLVLDDSGEVVDQGRVRTRDPHLRRLLSGFSSTQVAIEVGAQSPWVSRLIRDCGHEAVVANPRKTSLIYGNKRKTNRIDAEMLARLVRVDSKLLYPIKHRELESHQDLAVIRSRDAVVATRTKLINHVRGAVKAVGAPLPRCDAAAFARRVADELPEVLDPALQPVVDQIQLLTELIRDYDRKIEQMLEKYPATAELTKIRGVGALTAVTYVLVIEDPTRFKCSRSAGAFLGLVPGSDDTGDKHVQKGITKEGDPLLRKLLISAAHYILGPFGTDCDLRRHGERIAERGGKNGKKRAIVAVARKLAVLLHKLWVSGATYEPFFNSKAKEAVAA